MSIRRRQHGRFWDRCLYSRSAAADRRGCPSPPSAAPTRGPHEGKRVVAIVERLERSAHTEGLETDPIVIVSDVVAFGIFQPVHFDTLLFAHVSGHPRIDGRPLLLGDSVSFILPVNWRNRDLALEELAGLAFVEEHR